MVGLTDVDIPIILWISGGVTNKYLTIYLKLNVDEHKPENDEEEVVKSEPHPGRVEGAGVWNPEGGDHQSCWRGRGWRMRRPASRRGRSCGRGSAACWPGWAPASPLADSAAARPGSPPRSPASRPRSDRSANLKIVTIQFVC